MSGDHMSELEYLRARVMTLENDLEIMRALRNGHVPAFRSTGPLHSLLTRLDYIAKESAMCQEYGKREQLIAKLATVVAELVEYISSKEQP